MIVERSKDYFDAYSENCDGIYAAGNSIDAVKADAEKVTEKPKKTTTTTVISNSSSSSFGCGDRDSYGCGDSISHKSYSYGCGGSSSKYGC